MLIDTHCHLTHGRLRNQLVAVLDRAAEADVGIIIAATGHIADSHAAARLANSHENIYCTAGVHPHDAKDVAADYLDRLAELAGGDKCVAIGEIGLDYHHDFSPRPAQREIFAAQLDLAVRLGTPVAIHTREALGDTLAILADAGIDGERLSFHSFTGDADDVRRLIDLDAYVGYSGIATFKRTDDIRAGAALVPAERIMVETDAPYLSPEPVRKMKTNEPANVRHVAQCLAAARGASFEDFAEQTTANALRFFGIELLAAPARHP